MWFSGLIVMKCFCDAARGDDALLQMVVRLVKATDVEQARRQLWWYAQCHMERSSINDDGARVEWRAVEVLEVEAFEGFEHGAVLHSYLEWEHRTRGGR